MEDQSDPATDSDRSCSLQRSDSRVGGEKRGCVDLGEEDEVAHTRVKMRDLESVFRSEGLSNMGGSKGERSVKKHDGSLGLNTEVIVADNLSPKCLSSQRKRGREPNNNCIASRVGLDLNAKDVSSSANQAPLRSVKNHCHIGSRDISECGSTIGPAEDSDPLKRWMEMKQNGFLSSSYGGIPVPKPRARKPKTDGIKKKMEIAKREQVDRFTKIAAPSGLLNDLNPGIINHVRNRKQVHSIIESLVRSEKRENGHCISKEANHSKSRSNEISNWNDPENLNDLGANRFCLTVDKFVAEDKSGDTNSSMLESYCPKSCTNSTNASEDYVLVPKFSSSTVNASENAFSFSNEESGDISTVSSLSIKAATAASQWLELLYQDVKGRLAALRRSKKKVRAVISTELPFLISKEFSSDQENDPCVPKDSAEGFSMDATAEMHRARWTALFGQMDNSLSEDEKQLESWLNQVRKMQLHCDQGLTHNFQSYLGLDSRQLGTLENGFGQGKADASERELAVLAAAASIYSTCNLLATKENVSCF